MSKRVTSGLTGLQKKRAKPKRRSPEPQDLNGARDAYDRAIHLLGRMRTLAGLLEAHGWRRDAGELDGRMVSDAGGMIVEEAQRLHETLGTIRRKTMESHAAHT